MKQKLFSLLALFLFVSIGLTTDTKADSMGNELLRFGKSESIDCWES